MSPMGAAPRAAVPVSRTRAAASRRNGAKSRGPKTTEGKARSAQNALRHGMRAVKHIVLPDEDAVEFAQLQTALFEDLGPSVRSRWCSRGASRSRPGAWPGRIAWRPSCSRSVAGMMATSVLP